MASMIYFLNNHLSHQTIEQWQKKTTTYGVGSNLDPSLGKAPKCVEVNPVNCPSVDMLFRLDTSGHQAKQPFLSLILKYYFFAQGLGASEILDAPSPCASLLENQQISYSHCFDPSQWGSNLKPITHEP